MGSPAGKRRSKHSGVVEKTGVPFTEVQKTVRGRPRLNLDESQVRELAAIACTYEEIASVMKCSTKVLQRRYGALIEEGRQEGRASLRRKQFEVASSGNPTMLIWLGKQWLGQRDSLELGGPGGAPLNPPSITFVLVEPKPRDKNGYVIDAKPQKQLPAPKEPKAPVPEPIENAAQQG
jgi:hypothetical protein